MNAICLDFTRFSIDETFGLGSQFVVSDVTVTVELFVTATGSLIGNRATITDSSKTGGTDPAIEVNNVLLVFQLPRPCSSVTLRFGEYGGNINLQSKVNGLLLNAPNFEDINGLVYQGISFTATGPGVSGQGIGQLRLAADKSASITQFAIGGQELWISDICIVPVCE